VNKRQTFFIAAIEAAILVAISLSLILVPLTLVWFVENNPEVDWLVAFRAASDFWLLSHGTGLVVPEGEILGILVPAFVERDLLRPGHFGLDGSVDLWFTALPHSASAQQHMTAPFTQLLGKVFSSQPSCFLFFKCLGHYLVNQMKSLKAIFWTRLPSVTECVGH
jgi:hypothetical protein